ncbi:hypothetical protein H1230_01920 [Paenibacillus sp. 19GGS1-52]|uniref:hypothetical protein n=1 Tax=Paenibacillus sp. 19GGS1-52 TaxID=2758563 RepID=UPI001EFB0C16|nr:hypothetical protein [Paenibacillus sp. 19GGS1-52]ULO07662.1 hypothetical protein H1230_01920 [Paenibacillus sp. 19GGS1-52]
MKMELNRQIARKIGIMLESHLIWYKHYYFFCDEVIENMDRPPYWIIELGTKKYLGDAVYIVNSYAFSEPFEAFPDSLYDFHIGCLYLRYERKELSWASFLKESGDFADSYRAVKQDCQFFYYMLNDYQDSEYSLDLELKQAELVKKEFMNEIYEVQDMYTPFVDYFRKYMLSQR